MPALSGPRALALRLLEVLTWRRASWRHARHVAAYLLLMVAAVPLLEPLKLLDWRLLEALDARRPDWPGKVEVVDLGWNFDPAGTAAFRRDIATVLQALAGLTKPPDMVVLDVSISTLPIGIAELQAAAQALRDKRVRLFPVVDLGAFAPGLKREAALRHQGLEALYAFAAEFGHSAFEFSAGGSAWYLPCAPIAGAPPEDCVPALPQLVAARVAQPERSPTPLVGAPPVVFTPGRDGLLLQHLWRLQGTTLVAAGGQARDADAGLGSKIVIVGNIVHDRVGRWPGPELLAWAIGDAIATPGTLRTTLLRRPLWALGAALLFSGVALAAFALLRRADPRGRHLGGVAVGSALAALALLALCVVGLRQGLQVAHYQVSYAVVGIVVATLLAWHARRSALLESVLYTNVYDAPPGTSPAWDVFISYSHSPRQNIARVRRDLVEPLQRCSTADGPLRVFFDTSTIGIGTSWFTELAEGIERSRCFVAVYSDDYFGKSFCRFELRKAVVRDIVDQRRSFRVLPFKLDARADPLPEFSHLQFTEPENPGQMLQAVLQALRELGVHAA